MSSSHTSPLTRMPSYVDYRAIAIAARLSPADLIVLRKALNECVRDEFLLEYQVSRAVFAIAHGYASRDTILGLALASASTLAHQFWDLPGITRPRFEAAWSELLSDVNISVDRAVAIVHMASLRRHLALLDCMCKWTDKDIEYSDDVFFDAHGEYAQPVNPIILSTHLAAALWCDTASSQWLTRYFDGHNMLPDEVVWWKEASSGRNLMTDEMLAATEIFVQAFTMCGYDLVKACGKLIPPNAADVIYLPSLWDVYWGGWLTANPHYQCERAMGWNIGIEYGFSRNQRIHEYRQACEQQWSSSTLQLNDVLALAKLAFRRRERLADSLNTVRRMTRLLNHARALYYWAPHEISAYSAETSGVIRRVLWLRIETASSVSSEHESWILPEECLPDKYRRFVVTANIVLYVDPARLAEAIDELESVEGIECRVIDNQSQSRVGIGPGGACRLPAAELAGILVAGIGVISSLIALATAILRAKADAKGTGAKAPQLIINQQIININHIDVPEELVDVLKEQLSSSRQSKQTVGKTPRASAKTVQKNKPSRRRQRKH